MTSSLLKQPYECLIKFNCVVLNVGRLKIDTFSWLRIHVEDASIQSRSWIAAPKCYEEIVQKKILKVN